MTLEFSINNQTFRLVYSNMLVSDSENYLKAHFTFSPDWDGLSKIVYFKRYYDAQHDYYFDFTLDSTNTVIIPWEILKEEGVFRVGVYGQTTSHGGVDETVITCNYVEVHLTESCLVAGQIPSTPTQGIIGQTYAKIATVYDNLAYITPVGQNITAVTGVYNNLAAINAVNTNSANINTVATNIANVNTVGTNIAAVTNVNSNMSAITTVNANATNINSVAGNIAAITGVYNNTSNINAVNANASNINTVAGMSSNIAAIIADKANIDAVAGDLDNIDAASGHAATASAKATEAANSASAAALSATSAGTSATTATTKAGEASTSATNASTSETNAAASALSASGSATTATTKAGEASDSATTATTQAGIATTKAGEASTDAALSKQYAIGEPTEPAEGSAKYWAGQASQGQIQSDLAQTDNTKKDFIKNKQLQYLSDDTTHRLVTDTEKATWNGKQSPATTLAGYGITDAKITGGTITLGSNTITPLTTHQDISGKADKATTYTKTEVDTALATKQNTLTAGSNVQINGSTISATDTTYTAGTGISISGGTISNTQTVPTKTSDLTNDSGFITSSYHDSTKYDVSNPNGYTSNTGTVTSVAIKMNGSTKGTVTTSGTIDLGTVITSHQDISGKADKTTTVNGHALSSNVTVTKGDVGLGNCDNTSDLNKPISTATQAALNGKENNNALLENIIRSKKYRLGYFSGNWADVVIESTSCSYYGGGSAIARWYITKAYPEKLTEVIDGFGHNLSGVNKQQLVIYRDAGEITTTTNFYVYLITPNYNDYARINLIKGTYFTKDVSDVTSTYETEIADKTFVTQTRNHLPKGQGVFANNAWVNVTGTIMYWSTSSVPDGYLLCNGSAVSRSTYADLFAAIGTTYGAGDGSTTFNVPNISNLQTNIRAVIKY